MPYKPFYKHSLTIDSANGGCLRKSAFSIVLKLGLPSGDRDEVRLKIDRRQAQMARSGPHFYANAPLSLPSRRGCGGGEVLGSWFLVLGFWCLVLGSWCWVLGAGFLVLGSWCLVFGAWFLVMIYTLVLKRSGLHVRSPLDQ
jgi:hypothetical protein